MPKAYQLRIELRDFKPAIYRDVLVSPATPLPKLHKLIQAAMGWGNAHMHGFALPKKNERYYSVPAENRFDIPDPFDLLNPTNYEADFKLNDLLEAPKDKLLYLYDFGDDWEHIITLQAIVETESALPHLLQAEQGCPPEDCVGPSGAVYWASVWHDKAHVEHDIALEMFGRHEPGWLDVAALQKAANKLQPKPRKKSTPTQPDAVVCAALGHPFQAFMSAGNSIERVRMLEALGAIVTRVPQVDGEPGRVTGADIDAAAAAARAFAQAPPTSRPEGGAASRPAGPRATQGCTSERGAFYVDQFHNPATVRAHEEGTGVEICEQTGGKLDAVVMTAGTGGTITGVARTVKQRIPGCQIIGVAPEGSILAGPGPIRSYKVEGIGYDFIPDVLDRVLVDEWVKTDDRSSFLMSRRLIRQEGLLVGGSPGSAVWAAVQLAKRVGPGTITVYEGGLLGSAYEGKINAPNALHNLVYVSERLPDGSTFRTKDEEQLITTTDRWFRPVWAGVGPDGGFYMADWYDTRLSHVSPSR